MTCRTQPYASLGLTTMSQWASRTRLEVDGWQDLSPDRKCGPVIERFMNRPAPEPLSPGRDGSAA
jgi:hypothetical protein